MEHDAEWCSDGIKVSEKTKGVSLHYDQKNKILKMATIGDKSLVVTDEMVYFIIIIKIYIYILFFIFLLYDLGNNQNF